MFSSVPFIFHLPSLSGSDIRPAFLREIWTKHLPQHAWRRAQLLSLERLAPLHVQAVYLQALTVLLLPDGCWYLLSEAHRRQTARAKGCWWDPRKAKVVSEARKNGDTLSLFFLSAISHSGKVSQESCLVTRKFNFEQDSNFTTFFFT